VQHSARQLALAGEGAKGLGRRAEAAWAVGVERVSWWWLLLSEGGPGRGGDAGVTLGELEKEWATIAHCTVRYVYVCVHGG
jgi:hypothetical protein